MYLIRTLLARLSWRVGLYWLALLSAIWLFAELADEVYEGDGFFFDEPVLNWFYGLIEPSLTNVALGLSVLGGVGVMVALSLIITLGLLRFSKGEAVFFGVSMTGASLIMVLTKYLFARERPALFPDIDFWETASPSFPSGHATGSAAFFLALYLVISRLAPRLRLLAGLGGLLLALSISASRLYLQVHYPSDILAGLLLGAGWVLGVNWVYVRRTDGTRAILLDLPTEVVSRYAEAARANGKHPEILMQSVLSERAPAPTPRPEAAPRLAARPETSSQA